MRRYRNGVREAHEIRTGRWKLVLSCGHTVEISSQARPEMATCRECSKSLTKVNTTGRS